MFVQEGIEEKGRKIKVIPSNFFNFEEIGTLVKSGEIINGTTEF